MYRYMLIVIGEDAETGLPTIKMMDCNIHNKEEAEAERQWFIVTNEVDPANVQVVEYKG